MKAVVMHEFGPPEVLRYEDVPDSRPEGRDVLVKVVAVTVNNLDVRLRSGGYHLEPSLPHVLGWDPAGTVAEVGPEVSNVTRGQRVVFKGRIPCGVCPQCSGGRSAACKRSQQLGLDRWGGYAEYVCVPASNLHSFPENLSFAEASVIFRHFPQAFSLLEETASLRAGEWLVVMGAAGGLGAALVQVGKLLGATVIAGAGSDERVASCLANGADFAINYRAHDLSGEVMQITEGRGADVVTENIGDPSIWPGAFDSLGRSGRLVTVGAHAGGKVTLDLNKLYLRQLRIVGTAGSRPRDLESTVEAAARGKIRAVIGKLVPLSEAAEAHRLVEDRAVPGKVVLQP